MKRHFAYFSLVLFGFAACGDDATTGSQGSSSATTGTNSGAGTGGAGTSSSSGGATGVGGGSGLDFTVCLPTCTTPDDCSAGNAAYDGDNYDCIDGLCHYLGCNDDAECGALGNLVCRSQPTATIDFCTQACTGPAECAVGVAHLDEDNWSCEDGGCLYTGCNNDAECQDNGDFVCRDVLGTSYCMPSCTTAADCSSDDAPYDQDNWACEEGLCTYLGCFSDTECEDLGDYGCSG